MSHRSTSPEVIDPAFKLFGTHIPSPERESHLLPSPSAPNSADSIICSVEYSDNPSSEGPGSVCLTENDLDVVDGNSDPSTVGGVKKPDKILPCPRCNSMETKFCYFNNYNVNQPRHFCRSCQRYWTAGGSVRNLPVGAGRRKSKHASSKLQYLIGSTSEGCTSHDNLINCVYERCSTLRGTREVLINNTITPLYMSVENKLTLEEHEKQRESCVVTHGERIGDHSSSCSSLRGKEGSYKVVEVQQVGSSAGPPTLVNSLQGFPVPLPYPYIWNFGWNGMSPASGAGNEYPVPGNFPPMPLINGFCLPNTAYPFVTPSCWSWEASNEKIPCGQSVSTCSLAGNSSCSENTSSSLGKHSRDSKSHDEEKSEKNLWTPKTLRIDDPDEAAKSSIWTTLGITPGKNEPISKGGIFKAFQSRTERYVETSEAERALGANPAALSRSQIFHENT